MPYSRRRDHRSLAGHASARPGVDIHSVGGDSASDASVVDDMERGAAVGGDSASDSSVVDDTERGAAVGGDSASDASVVDDMDRKAAAVAGESEGSGIDLGFIGAGRAAGVRRPSAAPAVSAVSAGCRGGSRPRLRSAVGFVCPVPKRVERPSFIGF